MDGSAGQGEAEPPKGVGLRIIVVTFALSLGYAVLRYNVLGPIPWKDLPFFVLNKGLALTAFLLLTFNFTFGPLKNLGAPVPQRWLNARKALGMTGFLMALIHVFMAFLLFKPGIYGRFFAEDGRLTLIAGLSMLGGVLGFVFLWAYNVSFQSFLREDKAYIKVITSRRMLLLALSLGGVHLFFMGYKGWLEPSGWHGGLPPVSLVGFVAFVIGYVINLAGRH